MLGEMLSIGDTHLRRTMQQQSNHFHAKTPKETTLYMTTPELLAIRYVMLARIREIVGWWYVTYWPKLSCLLSDWSSNG
jgi:hypothetical protein